MALVQTRLEQRKIEAVYVCQMVKKNSKFKVGFMKQFQKGRFWLPKTKENQIVLEKGFSVKKITKNAHHVLMQNGAHFHSVFKENQGINQLALHV